MTHVTGVDAAVRRWLGVLLILAAAISVVGVPTATGFIVGLALLGLALGLFATAHPETPLDRMRRRRAH